MKKLTILLSITLLIALPGCWPFSKKAESMVIETHTISSIQSYIAPYDLNKDTLVIFDIDNTIARMKTSIGRDEWFSSMVVHVHKEGMSYQDAADMVLPTYEQILMTTPLETVEASTQIEIKRLQNLDLSVIALTARSGIFSDRTIEQLADLDIHFDYHSCAPNDLHFVAQSPRYWKSCYKKGVLFVGPLDKGTILKQWFTKNNYYPKRIVFIDDKLKNLKAVQGAAQELNIPFIGLRYNRLDETIAAYNFEASFADLEEFYKKHPEITPNLLQHHDHLTGKTVELVA